MYVRVNLVSDSPEHTCNILPICSVYYFTQNVSFFSEIICRIGQVLTFIALGPPFHEQTADSRPVGNFSRLQ